MTFYMLFSRLKNSKCGITVRIKKIKNKKINNKNSLNSQARAEGVKILGVRSIKKQEWGFSVGQPILIYVLVGWSVKG